jgi:hypothetical protein
MFSLTNLDALGRPPQGHRVGVEDQDRLSKALEARSRRGEVDPQPLVVAPQPPRAQAYLKPV